MESCSTSVELPILTTHLYRGESGAREVVYTGEWIELPSWKKRSHHEESSPCSACIADERPFGSSILRASGVQAHSA